MIQTSIVRWLAYFAGVVLTLNSITQAQTIVHDGSLSASVQVELWKWAVTQGGLVIVTLVILWAYRKDYKAEKSTSHEALSVMSGLVKDCVSAMTSSADAVREVSEALNRFERRYGPDDRRN